MKKIITSLFSVIVFGWLAFVSQTSATDTISTPNGYTSSNPMPLSDGDLTWLGDTTEKKKQEILESNGSRIYISKDKYITTWSDAVLDLNSLPKTIAGYVSMVSLIILSVSFIFLLIQCAQMIFYVSDIQKKNEIKKNMIFTIVGMIFFWFTATGIYIWLINSAEKASGINNVPTSWVTIKLVR